MPSVCSSLLREYWGYQFRIFLNLASIAHGASRTQMCKYIRVFTYDFNKCI